MPKVGVLFVWLGLCQLSLAKPLQVRTQSDLIFGEAVQGDGPPLIPAGTTETPTNASFDISGDKDKLYSVTIIEPAILSTSAPGVNTLTLSNFQYYSETTGTGTSGKLDNKGKDVLYVGATRNTLSINQAKGNYSGTFTINLAYQ